MPPVYQSHFLTPRFVTDLRTPVNAILENISKFFATEHSMVVMRFDYVSVYELLANSPMPPEGPESSI